LKPGWIGVNAAISASNLSETELLVGEIAAAATSAEKSVALADRSGVAFPMLYSRTAQADALHSAGEWEKAERLFAEAEGLQQYPWLYSLMGYWYCDLLLSRAQAAAARERASRTLEWSRAENIVLDVALDTLTLGRAHLVLAMQGAANWPLAATDASAATARFDKAVEGLRAAGQTDYVARGLLARAAFRRAIGDWDSASRDLDEAQEIAEPGPMRLFLCDCALERARLALARREPFAPLNGLVEPSPPPPALPDGAATAGLSV
jgi:tetratricopeptide (TPR) repeat protein